MKLSTYIERFPSYVASGNNILMEGPPGGGKSSVHRQLRDIMSERTGEEWGLVTCFLATMTPPDMWGYFFKGEMKDGDRTIAVTDPTLPVYMQTEDGKPVWHYPRGILVLDEYGQASVDVKAASAELLLSGKCGKWQLPKGWVVVALTNRMGDRSAVTKNLDFVINRVKCISLTGDAGDVATYASKQGWLPTIKTFIEQYPHLVFEEQPKEQRPFMSPRSLEKLNHEIVALTANYYGGKLDPHDPALLEDMAGLVGMPAAQQFRELLILEDAMPKVEDIIADPHGALLPPAERPDARMLVCYQLAHTVSEKTMSPVLTYISRLQPSFGAVFLRSALNRLPMLLVNPAVAAWAAKHSELMAVLASMKK